MKLYLDLSTKVCGIVVAIDDKPFHVGYMLLPEFDTDFTDKNLKKMRFIAAIIQQLYDWGFWFEKVVIEAPHLGGGAATNIKTLVSLYNINTFTTFMLHGISEDVERVSVMTTRAAIGVGKVKGQKELAKKKILTMYPMFGKIGCLVKKMKKWKRKNRWSHIDVTTDVADALVLWAWDNSCNKKNN